MRNRYDRRHRERDSLRITDLAIPEGVTDEIEISLWMIKEIFDIPTEEIEVAVESRRKGANKIKQTLKNE